MKVALCLSGHMRKFRETFPSLNKYVIQPHQCDVFIHTWEHLGYYSHYKSDGHLEKQVIKPLDLKNLYQPKKMIVQPDNFIDELIVQAKQYAPHLVNIPKPVYHMASMFYKIYAANELKNYYQIESGTQYDCVIRCRPDLIWYHPLLLEELKDNTIYVPKHISGHMWYSDQVAYGKPNEMDLYSSLFFDIPEYFKQKGEYYPERYLEWGIRKKKLNAQMAYIHFNLYR